MKLRLKTRYVLAVAAAVLCILLTVTFALSHLWLNALMGGMGTGVGTAFWGTAIVTAGGAIAAIYYAYTLRLLAARLEPQVNFEAEKLARQLLKDDQLALKRANEAQAAVGTEVVRYDLINGREARDRWG